MSIYKRPKPQPTVCEPNKGGYEYIESNWKYKYGKYKSYIKVSFKFFQLILLIEIVILFGLWIKWLIIEN